MLKICGKNICRNKSIKSWTRRNYILYQTRNLDTHFYRIKDVMSFINLTEKRVQIPNAINDISTKDNTTLESEEHLVFLVLPLFHSQPPSYLEYISQIPEARG